MDFSKLSYRSFVGRLVRLPLRLIPKRAVFPILQGKLRGKKWVVGAGEHGYWLGSYELQKRRAFEGEIGPSEVIYDIGANVGFYSLLAAHLTGPGGKVYAFEPLHRNVEYIRKHMALNQIEHAVVYEAAVAHQGGEVRFDPGASIATGHLSETGTVKVHQVSLDDLYASGEILPPNTMKIDVEGAEYAVLRGAEHIIDAFHPLIFLDTHGRDAHELTIRFLKDHGYQFEVLDGRPLEASKELIARPQLSETESQ